MLVMESDLTELTGGVFEAFLGIEAEAINPEIEPEGKVFTSTVNISGGWDGSVSVTMPEALARASASAMFGMSDDELGEDEVLDAIGELANIIGGNVKGMIENPCSLSLPVVASGTDYSVRVPGAELIRDVAMIAIGHPFHVAVHRANS